jgi:hypothetical protein
MAGPRAGRSGLRRRGGQCEPTRMRGVDAAEVVICLPKSGLLFHPECAVLRAAPSRGWYCNSCCEAPSAGGADRNLVDPPAKQVHESHKMLTRARLLPLRARILKNSRRRCVHASNHPLKRVAQTEPWRRGGRRSSLSSSERSHGGARRRRARRRGGPGLGGEGRRGLLPQTPFIFISL